ncbi:MAG: VOC family protein [Gammaproteobacteria bacterium]|nr:VOC family protein [Gammaproteobacteria bacterium]MDE0368424.1 VOC family protein [Gammaproteobacteria bacterium]
MINRLMKINLRVRSMERAKRLMTELLGGEVVYDRGSDTLGDYESCTFKVADVTFDVLTPASGESDLAKAIEKYGEGIDSICLAVDDVDALKGRLNSKDVRFTYEAEYQGHNIAFVHPRDVCGVRIEFMDGPMANARVSAPGEGEFS